MTHRGINIIFGLVLLVWPMFFFMSFHMFDTPGSESSLLTVNLAASIWLYPFIYMVSLVGSITANRTNTESSVCYYFARLPLIGLLWFLGSFVLLVVVCGGEFSC